MSPKEKAVQLVDMYWEILDIEFQNAKQCALIAVDEILNAIDGMVSEDSGYSADEYYLEVKQEIEKL